MARINTNLVAKFFQDRRVQIGLAVVVLLIVAAIVFLVMGGQGSEDAETEASAPSAPLGSQGPGGPEGFGGASPASPAAPGPAAGSRRPNPAGTAVASGALPNSFQNLPPALAGQAGGAAVAPAPPGVVKGRRPPTRPDPFVSFNPPRTIQFARPPATLYAVPQRLARLRPSIPRDLPSGDVIIALGPLPNVPRRVAGVLNNDGAVSAILETGTPGTEADFRVIQPGSTVPSGVPGIPDLRVESIGSTQVVLRAQDRRSVVVKLSELPPGIADQLRRNQAGGEGGIAPGGEGIPGAPPPGAE